MSAAARRISSSTITRTNRVVWRGWFQDSMDGIIDSQDRLRAELEKGVPKMMQELPRL